MLSLHNDLITYIALYLDFKTLPLYSACCKQMRYLVWHNPVFWRNKLQMDFGFTWKKPMCSDQETYKFVTTLTPQQGFERAAGLGWLELIIYYVDCFDDLDTTMPLKQAYTKKRKNVLNYLLKVAHVKPLTHFDFAVDLR